MKKDIKMKNYIFLCIAVFILNNTFGQGLDDFLPRIVPPSSEAAALGKYADIPISYYTGTTNISIPIYTIEVDGFTLPISLSYHSSGIKVNEEASWIGLGWVLNAGGVVARTVYGRDDFLYRIGNYLYDWPESDGDYNGFGKFDFTLIAAVIYPDESCLGYDPSNFPMRGDLYDAEPDIFSFNFCGQTGKFIYTLDGEPVFYPHQKLKIQGEFNDASDYTIIDQNGIQYIFDRPEDTKTVRKTDDGHVYDKTATTARYLTKIILLSGKEINFNYMPQNYHHESKISYTRKYYINQQQGGPDSYMQNHDDIIGWYLSSIEWDGNLIEFITEDRTDLLPPEWVSNTPKPQRLTGINVYNYNGDRIKSYVFEQSYFNDSQDAYFKRLKLDKVIGQSETDEPLPPYEFDYNDGNLYNKTGYGDHWDYFNNNDGSSLGIPPFKGDIHLQEENYFKHLPTSALVAGEVSSITFDIDGANREPSFPEMQAGILTEIKYPTGGRTSFEYENNVYNRYAISNEPLCKMEEFSYSLSLNSDSDPKTASLPFTIAEPSGVKFSFRMEGIYCLDGLSCGDNQPNVEIDGEKFSLNKIRILNPSEDELIVIKWEGLLGGEGEFSFNNYKEVYSTDELLVANNTIDGHELSVAALSLNYLPVGEYTLEITLDPNSGEEGAIFSEIRYFDKVCYDEFIAGGLRIKEKTDYDLDGNIIKSLIYDYGDGVLFNKPKYHGVDVEIKWSGLGACQEYSFHRYLELNSGNQNISSSHTGSHIGYETVTEISTIDGSQNNGYTEYRYNPIPNYVETDYRKAYVIGKDITPGVDQSFFFDLTNEYPGNIDMGVFYPEFYPYSPPLILDENIGNLLSIAYYNENSEKVREINYEYELKVLNSIPGLKVFEHPLGIADCYKYEEIPTHIAYICWYNHVCTYNQLNKETITEFNSMQEPTIETNILYFYDNPEHLQISRTIESTSDDKEIVSHILYPDDYSNSGGGDFIGEMKLAHIINKPIENVTYKRNIGGGNEEIISGKINTYKNTAGEAGLIDKTFILETTDPISKASFKFSNRSAGQLPPDEGTDQSFSKDSHYPSNPEVIYDYDSYRNIVQVQKPNGMPVSFIWGYSNTLPVLKAENAEYSTLNSAVQSACSALGYSDLESLLAAIGDATGPGRTKIRNFAQNLRNNSSLEDALISFYTFIPLAGMTSQTDPSGHTTYYEYDEFQRMKTILNIYTRILESYEYHYYNEP